MGCNRTKKNTLGLALWTAAWLISTAAATAVATTYAEEHYGLKLALVIINLVIGGVMIEMNRRHIMALDELQQKIHLQAMGITLGVTVIVGLAYNIADIGNLYAGDAEFSYLLILMSLSYLFSIIIGTRRYQ
ncbi:hypothetical protein [Pseudidiomarina homiensis]|uniref:Uncharacterized protein n=1 Tax=Pseudidiomarina homiensis TaxID=364198 RepID=A0A432Y5N7_9GAMM|nr:hypothetical protein [Pseudidiomarina homiensis]RUO56156.1 hypothetical protein CWI70_05210 [Pseudidiomarina homiensis]